MEARTNKRKNTLNTINAWPILFIDPRTTMNGLLLLAVALAGLVAVQAGKGHHGGYGYGNQGYGYSNLGYGHMNGLYNVGYNGLYNGWHGGLNNGWYGDDDYNNYFR